MSIFILGVDKLNQLKTEIGRVDEKYVPNKYCLQEIHFKYNDIGSMQVKI